MKVYLTYKNADMTEGRGPMVPDECFLHKEDAAKYIDSQPGVMGRRDKWSTALYGDWEVREITVHQNLPGMEEVRRQRLVKSAMDKLTADEKKALGLK